MNVMFDVVHPAHVHFYRHLRTELEGVGHQTLVVARQKDVTIQLLEQLQIPHISVGRAGHATMRGQLAELVQRDARMWVEARRFRPDLILTRNPCGVHVARAARAIGIFDTDDGRSAGIHFRAAAPFAHVITTPDCIGEDYGRRHRTYPGYKALAYLHPNRYQPDRSVRTTVGVSDDQQLAVIRLVSHNASHDASSDGISDTVLERLVAAVLPRAHVVISSERPLPAAMAELASTLPTDRMHDLLAAADVVVGDSQTVSFEAGLLGTAAVRINNWRGKLACLDDLEQTYGLVRSFLPAEADQAIAHVVALLDDDGLAAKTGERRARMLDDKVDVTNWYLELVSELSSSRRRRRAA